MGPARKIHPYPCPTDRRNRSCMRHLDDPESTLLSYKLNLSCMQRRQIRKFSAPTTNTTHTRSAVIHNGSALRRQSTFNNHPDPVLCRTAAIGKCSGGQHGHTDTFTVSPLSFIRIASESAGTRLCHHGQTDHDDRPCQPVLTIVGTDQSRNGLMLERTRFCNLRTNRCRYLSVQPTAWGNKAMSSARTDHDD